MDARGCTISSFSAIPNQPARLADMLKRCRQTGALQLAGGGGGGGGLVDSSASSRGGGYGFAFTAAVRQSLLLRSPTATAEELFALADAHDPFDVGACCAQLGSSGDNYTACLAAPLNTPGFELLVAPHDRRQTAAGFVTVALLVVAALVLLAVKLAQWRARRRRRAAAACMGLQAQLRPLLQPRVAMQAGPAAVTMRRCVL